MSDETETTIEAIPIADIQVRDMAKRELDIRIVPWNTVVDTMIGLEEFRRGAFSDAKPGDVLLMGLEHEAHMGLGQNGQPKLTRHPIGKAISLEDRPDAQYATFRVAKTARGDEVLALASEGIVTGASAEWFPVAGGSTSETHNGRRKSVHTRARLTAVSTTYQPAYKGSGVIAVRSHQEAPVAEDQAAVAAPAEEQDFPALDNFGDKLGSMLSKVTDQFGDRIDKLEERYRSQFTVPAVEPEKAKVTRGEWMETVIKILSGDRIPDQQMRSVADLITSDNAGIVPDSMSSELIGVIDGSRPFMASTRRLATPTSGLKLVVPVITQRPIVGLQSEEKAELASQETKIETVDFDMVTKGGVGDLSLQILKRADRSFLDLYLQLLAEALAIESETEAVEALLGAEVDDGNSLDPNDLSLGSAFTTAFDVIRRPPDTIWLSSEAVGAFIDAKANGTNAPLYSNIVANATAGGGISGSISGLRAVHVPVLNGAGADVIVGPSNGFAWAEDGSYTLQVDVPSKAGRDVALVSMYWFAPWYPTAFTVYSLTS